MLSQHQTLMAIRRRWPVLVVLTLTVLLLLQKPDFLHFIPSLPSNDRPTPYTPEHPVGDNRFHWENFLCGIPWCRTFLYQKARNRFHEFSTHLKNRERAWSSDELAPVSGLKKDTFGDWAATLADTLDTLWIADLKEGFHDGVEALQEIDSTKITQGKINVFETTIRYLGGFSLLLAPAEIVV